MTNKKPEVTNDLTSKNYLTNNCTSYRGFISIDQEMEKEIAMQWFSTPKETLYSHRSFLHKEKK